MGENWFNITTVTTVTAVTAVWGAFLATVHGAFSLRRVWIDRPKVTVTTSITSCADVGNTVIIHNNSPKRIVILGWNIYYYQKGWFKKKSGDILSSFDDGNLMTVRIESYDSLDLSFEDQYHFSSSISKGDLYIELHIVGRTSPVVLKL